MVKFPEGPFFTGVNAPGRAELDIDGLEVVGEIPTEIDGVFYRVAADHQFPPRLAGDIPVDGHALVSRYRFKQGTVRLQIC